MTGEPSLRIGTAMAISAIDGKKLKWLILAPQIGSVLEKWVSFASFRPDTRYKDWQQATK